jgi:hypothetical protein
VQHASRFPHLGRWVRRALRFQHESQRSHVRTARLDLHDLTPSERTLLGFCALSEPLEWGHS